MSKSKLKVNCPSCGRTFSNVKPEYIGQDAQCMQCGNIFCIEIPDYTPPPEPVPSPVEEPEPLAETIAEAVEVETEEEPEQLAETIPDHEAVEIVAEEEPEPVVEAVEIMAEEEPEPIAEAVKIEAEEETIAEAIEIETEEEPEPVAEAVEIEAEEIEAEEEPEPVVEAVEIEAEEEPEPVVEAVEIEAEEEAEPIAEAVEIEVEPVDSMEETELYAEAMEIEPESVGEVEAEPVDSMEETELYAEAVEVEATDDEEVFIETIAAVEGVERPPDTPQDKGWALEELIETIDEEVKEAFEGETASGKEASTKKDIAENQELFVVFFMNESEYAVPVKNVTEITLPPDVTELPKVPGWVRGVTNLRGEIMSSVDLKDFLGMGQVAQDKSVRMLVARSVQDEDFVTGLMVDSVVGIFPISTDKIGAATAPIHDQVMRYFRGVYEREDRLLVVLNLELLLMSEEMRQFEMDLV